jgi:type III secretion protein Q
MTPELLTATTPIPATTPRAAVARAESLTGRLPALRPAAARAARVGFDGRFPRWLSERVGVAAQVHAARPPTELLSLDLRSAAGRADVALDPAQWPALAMAAALPDAELAREVADALLAPLAARLAPLLPGLRLGAIRRYPSAAVSDGGLPALAVGGGQLSLVRLDRALADHLDALMRDGAASPLGRLAALRVPMRLALFDRPLGQRALHGLAAGDVVLAGAARRAGPRWRVTLKFGLGITMQATADLDLDASRAHLAAPPRLVDEAAMAAPLAAPQAQGLEHLQVPVSFEIDSARIALGELASLGEGAVIELDVPLSEASVRLVCHGQTLGIGQLVAIGDQLGVRILRMGLGATGTGPAAGLTAMASMAAMPGVTGMGQPS